MELIKTKIVFFFETYGPEILGAAVTLIVGLVLIKFFLKALKKIMKKSKLDPICHKFFLSLSRVGLYMLLIIVTLSIIGIPMTSLITVLGAAGLAVGLAVQDSLSNLAGGFILLFSKPFSVGDFVELSGVSGTVKHINILQTKLLTPDNKAIIIPNGQVSSAKLINYSSEKTRRLDLTFSTGYKDDSELVKQLLTDILTRNELVILDPPPVVRLNKLADSAVEYVVRAWVKTEDYWDLNFDIMEDVKSTFDKRGIEFPFKQLDVHIKQEV